MRPQQGNTAVDLYKQIMWIKRQTAGMHQAKHARVMYPCRVCLHECCDNCICWFVSAVVAHVVY